ncbi:hypothetical protein AcV7_002801 [Taiwanofungus camphoratus]|nr:hypothetical protein AcV7_002801 [Antrodia cinnamomea]
MISTAADTGARMETISTRSRVHERRSPTIGLFLPTHCHSDSQILAGRVDAGHSVCLVWDLNRFPEVLVAHVETMATRAPAPPCLSQQTELRLPPRVATTAKALQWPDTYSPISRPVRAGLFGPCLPPIILGKWPTRSIPIGQATAPRVNAAKGLVGKDRLRSPVLRDCTRASSALSLSPAPLHVHRIMD